LNKVTIWILLVAAALVLVMQVIPLSQNGISCDCGEAVTKIHTVQGAGEKSPLVGQTVTVSAVVVGDFQDKDGLKGFFVQEEDRDADSDPATSEGLFVYDPGIQSTSRSASLSV